MCGDCLTTELSLLNGGGLEITAASLPYGCCQGLSDCIINEITTILTK